MNEKHQTAIVMLRKSGIELERRCEMYEEYLAMVKEKGLEDSIAYLQSSIANEKALDPA